MSSKEFPIRFPPPSKIKTEYRDGLYYPVLDKWLHRPECGQKVQLVNGDWVVCIRDKGHPVVIGYGHSNGYTQWLFDEGEQ